MAEQERRQPQRRDDETEAEGSGPDAAAAQETTEKIDELLEEIDSVLEENAEEFVKNYVQKGGE